LQSFLFNGDLGCNELWLQGVYHVTTPYVLILHDDDELAEDFGLYYWGLIRPELERSVGWVLWDAKVKEHGRVLDENHRLMPCVGSLRPVTGLYDPAEFFAYYRDNAKCVYPISPVVQIMRTDVARRALKECAEGFRTPEFFTRPTMMIGNEILMTLRSLQAATESGRKFLYVAEPLTYFGRHDGSESEVHARNGSQKLARGYTAARNYFNRHERCDFVPSSKVVHAVSLFDTTDPSTRRRHFVAQETWKIHYELGRLISCPVWGHQLTRDSSVFGDPRCVPFVTDVINAGMSVAAPEDIVVVTNADTCLSSDAVDRITESIGRYGCCFTFRRDFHRPLIRPVPDSMIRDAHWYVGSDLFAFTPAWWREFGPLFPEFLIGQPCWDWVMRCLMGYSVMGKAVFDLDLEEQGRVVECPGIIYHEKHESWHERPDIAHRDRANLYNFMLAYEWFRRHAGRTNVSGSYQFPTEFRVRSSNFWSRINELTGEDRARVERVAGARYLFVRPGFNQWQVDLQPSGVVGKGSSQQIRWWTVWNGKLVLANPNGEPTFTLDQQDDGRWVGNGAELVRLADSSERE
jgi:hypothetical protein